MPRRRSRGDPSQGYGYRDIRLVQAGSLIVGWTIGFMGRPIRVATWAAERFPLHTDNWAVIHGRVQDMLQRPKISGETGKARPLLSDPAFQQQYPMLWSHLTQTTWEDGTARQTSTLLVFLQDGVLKCMLRDVEAQQVLWTAGNGWNLMLHAVEANLASPGADWRADRRQGTADKAVRRK